MYEQDYIMRQIKECVAVAMKVFFDIETDPPASLIIQNHKKQVLADNLMDKIDSGKIEQAIFELKSETCNKYLDDLLLGYKFYSYLCQKDDDFLEKYNINYYDIKNEMKNFFAGYISSDIINLLI